MKIRLATETDTKDLARLNGYVQQLHVDLAPDLYRQTDSSAVCEWFAEQIHDSRNMTLVAELNGLIVGYSLIRMIQRPAHVFCHDRSCAYLDQICVAPEHRRKGVGRELLREAVARASEAGMSKLELDVRSDNELGKASFNAMGFRTFGEKMALELSALGKS